MSFSENLKQVRKERGLSQEELAELLDVSRQAVSKWEQGIGYPEVEKLLLISSKLNISLDSLMLTELVKEKTSGDSQFEKILIISSNENIIMSCSKIISSKKFKNEKWGPSYALFGVDGSNFWGENMSF